MTIFELRLVNPLVRPDATSTTLVLPPTAIHVTRTSLVSRVTEVMRNPELALVGLVPAVNSAKLFRPSPSGSIAADACGQTARFVQPKYCNCHSWNGAAA